jgi:nitroimidazol reductase NimA-like FMN-containing flavoprotein (pyridoxamine 5'-phosphate oxidase superfamily)
MVRTELTRIPESAVRDRAALDALLDEVLVAHIGFVVDDHPVVIPTAIVRDTDRILVHGSTGSRWMRGLAAGSDASVAVTAVDALVVSRSAFESSIRYRSAVLFGRFSAVDETVKPAVLDVVTEGLIPGRTAELRVPTPRELAATLVLEMPIAQWSMKVAQGWPEDGPEDVVGPAWAGIVPIHTTYGPPEPAPDLGPGRPVPESVRALFDSAERRD